MNNETLKKSIELDDLNTFKTHFDISKWKQSITQIENYAGVSQYTPEITYNDCDVLKYSLHCQSDTIFNYLLPQLDTNKHGDNYGWPLLAMAIKLNRYDYANSILHHPSFDPYPMYHTNQFGFIETKINPEKHIDFLFNYLNLFDKYDFQNSRLIYVFTHLICFNEETFQRFESIYQSKINNPNASVLNIFQDHQTTLAKEIFYNYFRPFILDKLDISAFRTLLESVMNEKIIFVSLFEGEHAKEGLSYLLKAPDLLQKYFDNNNNYIMVSYLPLDCIILLENHGIDIFVEDEKNNCALDFILKDLDDPSTLYFLDKYTQIIYDRLEKEGRKNSLQKYCHQKLLHDKFLEKNIKTIHTKI